MTYNDALALINAEIVTNGNNEITAMVLNPVLKAMIDFPNDVIGVLADLDTTDVSNIVNAINSIISENLPNATSLRPIDTTGVDFDQAELLWVRDAVNNTIANNGNFTCQLGQQMVFYCDVLISSDGSEAIYQRRYYRLLTGAVLVSAVSESDLMPDGIEARTLDLTGALVIDLGDIGTDDVEDAFNSDPNQPFAISGDKFIKAVQSTVDKLWYWIGGDGNFGNSATLAESTDFVDLTDGASPPVAAIYSLEDLIDVEITDPATGEALTYDSVSGTWKNITPAGSGDVVGPAVVVDEDIAVYDGTTGKLIKKLAGVTSANVIANNAKLTADATNVDSAGAVMETDYNANTILAANSDDTPAPITIAEQTLLGRITAGNIAALTVAQIKTLLAYIESDINGVALYNAATTGAVNIPCSTFASWNRILTGNTTLTFTETPASGESFTRFMMIKSATTETLAFGGSPYIVGEYVNDGNPNFITIELSNYPTEGLVITVFINQPT